MTANGYKFFLGIELLKMTICGKSKLQTHYHFTHHAPQIFLVWINSLFELYPISNAGIRLIHFHINDYFIKE